MELEPTIFQLEEEWEKPFGFFGCLREGDFDPDGFKRVENLLKNLNTDMLGNRRLISLIWYIPLFMNWQKERVFEKGGDISALERSTNILQGILEDVLGVP
jgi:hypothetical protein